MNYVPLYVQTEYSFLNSTCHIKRLVKFAKENNFTSLAMTDDGNMHGVIKFYKECTSNGIKPIIGLKLNISVNNNTRAILLYAKNNVGYYNLLKLSSVYSINNLTPLSLEELYKYHNDIICIYPLEENNAYANYSNGYVSSSIDEIEAIKEQFDDFYCGHSMNSFYAINNFNVLYNAFNAYKCVAINRANFINQSEEKAYGTLLCIKSNSNNYLLNDIEKSYSFKSNDQMNRMFNNYKNLLEETNAISNRCNVSIDFNGYKLPLFDESINSAQYLKELSIKGLRKRLSHNPSADHQKYIDRLQMEYNLIIKMGFVDYFLIVWDYVKYAKQHHIYVGPGRGSAVGSLLAYSLGIIDVDPLQYNLFFERFLNPERVSMPDIDIDFPNDKKEDVINYVVSKYGINKVAHVVTFTTYKNKVAINDVSKVLNLSDNYKNAVSKIINQKDYEGLSLSEILNRDDTFKQLVSTYPEIKEMVDIAIKIYDLPKNVSTHASAVLISKDELNNYTALMPFSETCYQTQLEGTDLESLGLLKMDFLALKNLTNIIMTIDSIKKEDPSFEVPVIENNPKVYQMISSGDVDDVFQIESKGCREMLMQMHPTEFKDIVNAIALYRPGTMDIFPTYNRRLHHEEPVVYLHPDLEPILKDTLGLIVYQEQIMQICQKIAGYSLGKADVVRRAIAKKKMDVLQSEKENFVRCSINRGYSMEVANKIFDYIVKFGDYGFNKSHSVGYAKLTYLTAYLKCMYPKHYLSIQMDNSLGSSEDIFKYTKDAKKNGLNVYQPSIVYSTGNFMPVKNGILFPLKAIIGLGDGELNAIIEERNKKMFESYSDFITRMINTLGKELCIKIINSGALDSFKLTHKAMIDTLDLQISLIEYAGLPGLKEIQYTKDEFTYSELETFEKESIGFNLRYNFFSQYDHLYAKKGLKKISFAKEGEFIKTIGFVKSIKNITTKSNESMCFLTIEDDFSNISVTVFPKLFKDVSNLKENDIIVINGRCEKNQKNSELLIVADGIIKL